MKFFDMNDSCPPKILPFESVIDIYENMLKVMRQKTSKKAFAIPKPAQQKGANLSLTKTIISKSMKTSFQAFVGPKDNDNYGENKEKKMEKEWKQMIHPEKLFFKLEVFNGVLDMRF